MEKKFELGKIFITKDARKALIRADIDEALSRYENQDWGEYRDIKRNDSIVKSHKRRIKSVYRDLNDREFWITTEIQRVKTTISLPEYYTASLPKKTVKQNL